MNIAAWLGRLVGATVVATAMAACSSSTSDDTSPPGSAGGGGGGDASGVGGGGSDATADSGDGSTTTRIMGDGGQCVSSCHQGDPCGGNSACASGTCTGGICVDPSCADGTKDGTETAADCGGTCAACVDGTACVVNGDCTSKLCDPTKKVCDAPTASDGVKNGTESDTDCGGSGSGEADHAPACADGKMCATGSDCADKECGANGTCTPSTCKDGVQNGTETAPDCGGMCSACADGLGCATNKDCTSKSCDVAGTMKCLAPTSSDKIQNGNETDADCGSSGSGEDTKAPPCADTLKCNVSGDCADKECGANGTCTPSSCKDGVQNGTETGTDCGGVCSACADGVGCAANTDCTSKSCDINGTKLCLQPTSSDKIQNGNETDTDCGSSGTGEDTKAPACADSLKCGAGTDCIDKECGANGTCTAASCKDGVQNGTETGTDCGGTCNACADTLGCKVDADCTSKHCDIGNTNKCLVPTSTDGRQNGNETDTDCGSDGTGETTHAGPCLDGKKCVKGADCIDEVCGANLTCSAPTCSDKVKNGSETGVDCGDTAVTGCPACGDGMGCNPATTPSDCSSLVCNAATKTCTAPTSSDGTQNGNESDVDCGSSGTGENTSAPACPDINGHTKVTSKCSASADCKSGYCNATEKQCVDGASCALPALAKASGIQDIKTAAKTTSATTNDANDAVGTPNVNGAGLYAGIDTCGQGEATDAPGSRKLESCCKSLDVAATGDRVDKYEVTAGRMRQFVESINAKYPDYNFKAWVAAQFSGTTNLPTTAIGTTLFSQIPTPTAVANSTDTRVLFPSSQHGVLNAVEQLGATSIDTGIPSDLQGCYVGPGNAGSSTYWWDAAGESIVGSPPRQFTQDYYDIKPLNCALYWMAAAFCAWDGGYLPDDAHYQALWGTGNYPWGADTTYPTTSSGSRNYEDLGGGAAYGNAGSPAITKYTINNPQRRLLRRVVRGLLLLSEGWQPLDRDHPRHHRQPRRLLAVHRGAGALPARRLAVQGGRGQHLRGRQLVRPGGEPLRIPRAADVEVRGERRDLLRHQQRRGQPGHDPVDLRQHARRSLHPAERRPAGLRLHPGKRQRGGAGQRHAERRLGRRVVGSARHPRRQLRRLRLLPDEHAIRENGIPLRAQGGVIRCRPRLRRA